MFQAIHSYFTLLTGGQSIAEVTASLLASLAFAAPSEALPASPISVRRNARIDAFAGSTLMA